MKLNELHDDLQFIPKGIEDHFAKMGYYVFLGPHYVGISRTNNHDAYIIVFISDDPVLKMGARIYNRSHAGDEIEFDICDPACIPKLERLVEQHLGIPETHP